jgi:hypothetical protein
MAFVVADRVQETTTTTGTGTVTLAGAVTGFQSFSAIGNGNSTFYTIADQSGSNWEVGIGTYTSSGTTLSRTTVLSSSNSGSLVNFGAGTKNVFVTYPAGRSAYAATVPSDGQLLIGNGTDFTLSTLTGGGGISIVNGAGTITISSGGGGPSYATYTFTGNGSTTSFDTTVSGLTVNNVLVLENGITQVPTTDYTISGTSVVFTTAPASGVAIQVRILAGGGGGGSGVIAETQQTISSNYTVTSAYNGMSVGPVTINTGVAVTVGTDQRWLIFG